MPPQNTPTRKLSLPGDVSASSVPVSEPRTGEAGQTGLLPPVPEESYPPGATPLEPLTPMVGRTVDGERLDRLESLFERFSGHVGERLGQMMHVIDRLASVPRPDEEAEDAAPRVRPDEHLLKMAEGVSREELLRMLELRGSEDEAARLRAEGISPGSHWIATDCMVIGLLDADGKVVGTKVSPGEAIPRERLPGATIDDLLKHHEGAKLARPGEYRAPKPTPAHTR